MQKTAAHWQEIRQLLSEIIRPPSNHPHNPSHTPLCICVQQITETSKSPGGQWSVSVVSVTHDAQNMSSLSKALFDP